MSEPGALAERFAAIVAPMVEAVYARLDGDERILADGGTLTTSAGKYRCGLGAIVNQAPVLSLRVMLLGVPEDNGAPILMELETLEGNLVPDLAGVVDALVGCGLRHYSIGAQEHLLSLAATAELHDADGFYVVYAHGSGDLAVYAAGTCFAGIRDRETVH